MISYYLFQDIVAIGVTNQRETTIVWDKDTGKPLHNAIVWLDMRTSSTIDKLLDTVPNKTRNKNYLKVILLFSLSQSNRSTDCSTLIYSLTDLVPLHWRRYSTKVYHLMYCWLYIDVNIFNFPCVQWYCNFEKLEEHRYKDNFVSLSQPLCGLPLSPYFSAVKLRWLTDNVEVVKKAIKKGTCCFGTVDTWVIWNLTGMLFTYIFMWNKEIMLSRKTQWEKIFICFWYLQDNLIFCAPYV